MEDTSWISGIFANPFLRGLLVGLFIALVLWVRGLFKVRDLNGRLKKLAIEANGSIGLKDDIVIAYNRHDTDKN